jgi:hypothetical protein
MINNFESLSGVESLKLVSFSIPDHAIQEMIIFSHELINFYLDLFEGLTRSLEQPPTLQGDHPALRNKNILIFEDHFGFPGSGSEIN